MQEQINKPNEEEKKDPREGKLFTQEQVDELERIRIEYFKRHNLTWEDEPAQNKDLEKRIGSVRRPGLFISMTANEVLDAASRMPTPKMLFGEFWFEGEICILFADTNVGKSILAVQIADSISRGIPIKGFDMDAERQKILYFDFELSTRQIAGRYMHRNGDRYIFDDNLIRVTMDPNDLGQPQLSYEEYLAFSITEEIEAHKAKVLIIDNITYLRDETEKAKDALPLMKQLKVLKEKYDLSILVLAHTPKRDSSKPLHKNDVQGSKMITNFCDSAFAIGESSMEVGLRYLKQIKVRNMEFHFGGENVVLCKINRPDNFLQFELIGYDYESNHLKQYTQSDKEDLIEKVKELSASGMSQREIAGELGLSVGVINKYLKS